MRAGQRSNDATAIFHNPAGIAFLKGKQLYVGGNLVHPDSKFTGAAPYPGPGVAEQDLFDGDYFIQRIEWKNLHAKNPLENKSMVGNYSPEAVALFEKEGPKYQYGSGCLADGVLALVKK